MALVQYLLQHEPSFRESRLPSLYSDLTNLHNTNPEGFAANSQAWTSALIRLAVSGNLPTEQRLILSTSTNLLNALSSPSYGRPVGLGAVLDEAVREKKMVDLAEFTKSEKSIYSRSWIPSPWSILSWTLRTARLISAGTYDRSGDLRPGNLVLLPALEELTKKIVAWQQRQNMLSLTNRIFTRDAFASEMATLLPPASNDLSSITSQSLSAQDLDVLLTYLSRDNPILSHNKNTIKFRPASSSAKPDPITQEDTAIAKLRSLISDLTVQVSDLESKISAQTLRAKHAVTNQNKPIALAALRSKKAAERTLSQRTATLSQCEEVFTQIENAAGQAEVVETLRTSSAALKALNKKVGDVDSIDAVLEELREEMQKTGEVQNVLAEPLTADSGAVADEVEVDEELEAMEQEEQERIAEREARDTEKKLAALEGLKREEAQQIPARPGFEAQLSKSTEKMDGLSLSQREPQKEKTQEQAQSRMQKMTQEAS